MFLTFISLLWAFTDALLSRAYLYAFLYSATGNALQIHFY